MAKKMLKVIAAVVGLLLMVAVGLHGYFYLKGPDYGENRYVKVVPLEHKPIPEDVKALHDKLFIIDLHADPLLWARDLSIESERGHVDVPRLIKGNVGLQVFGVVSQLSPIHNHEYNPDVDALSLLTVAQRWPMETWFSIPNRGFYQAEKLKKVVKDSAGKFMLVRTKQDLQALQTKRKQGQAITGGLLAFEGAQVLDGSMALYHQFYEAGYRMIGLTHFFDTEAAGSRHGVDKYGLTDFGKALIKNMEKDGVVLDLAHASEKATTEALAFTTKPVVISHTGVRGVCDRIRNLSDEHIKGVAKVGGVVGIGYWQSAACGLSPETIVKSIRYVADLVGVDYVGLGSDFDGAVTTAFDTSQLLYITHALREAGFGDEDISKIMGGNVLRLLLEVLPSA